MTHQHLSEKELQQLIDLSEEDRRNDESFARVESCPVCKQRFQSVELIHNTLRKQQVEPADEVQVERIMTRVRSGGADSMLVHFLQRFAYVVALTLVLGIVGIIFYQFNIIDFEVIQIPAAEATGIFWEYYKSMQEQLTLIGGTVADAYDRVFGVETFPILIFTVLILLIVAVLDKWLLSPLLRRG